MEQYKIKTALISVWDKSDLEPIIHTLHSLGIQIVSTGGTLDFISKLNIPVVSVESITHFPEILDGRVKTLHPGVFGGILARRTEVHLQQLATHNIPQIDLIIVDLYPFEDTAKQTTDEQSIIEKIDIGGISLIRAAAKNFESTVIISSKTQYAQLLLLLQQQQGTTNHSQRKTFAMEAFAVTSHYDTAIFHYFTQQQQSTSFRISKNNGSPLRYGENPHQSASYYGDLNELLHIRSGKDLSYNNMLDLEAAIQIMHDFKDDEACFAILKHTNVCGIATRTTLLQAWKDALAGDPISAFGGVLICNKTITLEVAQEIDTLFYEILVAPTFDKDAFELLQSKKNRILIELHHYPKQTSQYRSMLDGVLQQDYNSATITVAQFEYCTTLKPNVAEISDLLYAAHIAKHLKSNAIAIVKNKQLIGMGCGQTSRVDACKQAITKAGVMGFNTTGAAMASEAFFPFPDCIMLAAEAGITSVIQPGGSVKDKDSIQKANELGLSMVLTGTRFFKH